MDMLASQLSLANVIETSCLQKGSLPLSQFSKDTAANSFSLINNESCCLYTLISKGVKKENVLKFFYLNLPWKYHASLLLCIVICK